MNKARVPNLNQTYYSDGRELMVMAVELGNREGREVRGQITGLDNVVRDYSTSLIIFWDIWKEQA